MADAAFSNTTFDSVGNIWVEHPVTACRFMLQNPNVADLAHGETMLPIFSHNPQHCACPPTLRVSTFVKDQQLLDSVAITLQPRIASHKKRLQLFCESACESGEPEWLRGRIEAWKAEIKYLLVCKMALGLLPMPPLTGTGLVANVLLRAYAAEGTGRLEFTVDGIPVVE